MTSLIGHLDPETLVLFLFWTVVVVAMVFSATGRET